MASIFDSIFGEPVALRAQNNELAVKNQQNAQIGGARAKVMSRLSELKANGGRPDQLMAQIMNDPVFIDAFTSDPDIAGLVNDMTKAISTPDPKYTEVSPGGTLVRTNPGDPSAPPETVFTAPGKAENPTQGEAAAQRLIDTGVLNREQADKFLLGVIKGAPVLDSLGRPTGAQVFVDLTDPDNPIALQQQPGGGAVPAGAPGAGGVPGANPAAPAAAQPGAQPASVTSGDIPSFNTGAERSQHAQYAPMFAAATQKYGLPVGMIDAVANQESRFNPRAVGIATRYGRAKGIMQFIDGTAQQYGVNQFDPASSIDGGGKLLRRLLDMYDGDVKLALAGYNWGPGNVNRWIEKGANPASMPAETRNYIAQITGDTKLGTVSPSTRLGASSGGRMSAPQQPTPAPAPVAAPEGAPKGFTPVANLMADPSEMFLGAGLAPITSELIGGIAGQLGAKGGGDQSQSSDIRRNGLRQLRFAVQGLNAGNKGQQSKQELGLALDLVPSMGPLESPEQALNNGIQLFDMISKWRQQASEFEANDTSPKEDRLAASQRMHQLDTVMAALPTREQMVAQLEKVQKGTSSALTPDNLIEQAKEFFGSAEGAVSNAASTAVGAPKAEATPKAAPAKPVTPQDIGKMTMEQLGAVDVDSISDLATLDALSARYNALKGGAQ